MDEIVYQCPECNFNTDNVGDLDGHMDEFHANLLNQLNDDGDDMDGGEYVDDNHDLGEHNEYGEQLEHGDLYIDHQGHDMDDDMQNIEPYSEHDLEYGGGGGAYNDYEDSTADQHQQQHSLQHHTQQQNHLYQLPHHQQAKAASTPNGRKQQPQGQARTTQPKVSRKAAAATAATQSGSTQQPVINSDNHYERQYTCKRCGFFTNNPRAVLYHRRDFHGEKINVHECIYCQYASQYSGKVERHTLLRHKIHSNNTPKGKMNQMKVKGEESFNQSLNMTAMAGGVPDLSEEAMASNRSMNRSVNGASASAAVADDLNTQPDSPLAITKFQCNRCPCKYKRSNDLSKHLKSKHGEVAQRLSDYLVRIPLSETGMWAKTDGADSGEGASGHGEDYSSVAADEDLPNATLNDVSTLSQPGSSGMRDTELAKQEPAEAAHQQGSYECPYCTYYSQGNDSEYLAHVKDHLSGKSFRCVLCNSVYKYRGDCVVHLKRKHQKADMYAQNYVERFSLETVDIGQVCVLLKPKQSEENENEEKLFGCAYCDYKANYKGDVFKHQTRRHPGCVKNVTALAQATPAHLNQLNLSVGAGSHGRQAECSPFKDGQHRASDGPARGSRAASVFQHNHNSLNTANRVQQHPNHHASHNHSHQQRQRQHSTAYQSSSQQQRYGQTHKQAAQDLDGCDQFDQNHEQIYYNNSHVKDSSLDYENAGHEDYEELYQDETGNEGLFDETAYEDAAEYDDDLEFANQVEPQDLEMDQASNYLDNEARSNHTQQQAKRASTILASVLNGNGAALIKQPAVRPGSALSSLSSSSHYSSNPVLKNQQDIGGALSQVSSSYLANLKFLANRRSQHALRERKFKCPLCPRTSKWQWDIRKHMRTVHRGQDTEREVVVLKEKDLVKRLQGSNGHHLDLDQIKSKCAILNNRSFNAASACAEMDQQDSPSDTDPTGNKRFKCTACPYRSNWKADLFRHLRKSHAIQTPQRSHIIELDNQVAAHTLNEYESTHGINIMQRKRSHTDPNDSSNGTLSGSEGGSSQAQQNKRNRLDLTADTDLTSQETCLVDELDARNQLQQEENWVELQQRNNRLPVSIAELNIKPYKCLRCGFRSDRKSDTLRHIRVKHSLSNQAVKFLRIMSIKEASDSIEEYENFRLYKKIKNFKNNGGGGGGDNSAAGSIPSTAEELSAALAAGDLQNVSDRSAEEECGSSATWSGMEDFACAKSGGGVGHRSGPQSKADKRSRCSPADLYRCPFCSFKNSKKMVMRRHLVIHFSGAQAVRVTNPVYRCSLCTFRSKWQFFVKKHITTHHLSVKNAYVLRYPARSAHQRLDRENQTQQMDEQHGSDGDQDGSGYQNGDLEPEDSADGAAATAESSGLETGVTVEQGDEDAAAADADWSEQNNNQENQDENNRCNYAMENDSPMNLIMPQPESCSDNSQEPSAGGGKTADKLESVTLTAHDGSTFQAQYYVEGAPCGPVAAGAAQPLSPVANRRKAYYCAACPFQTKTFNNVKAHLANHHYIPDSVKCRYCVYYVGNGRLLRQHELLHSEFQELPEHSSLKRSTSFTNKSLVHA